MRTLATLGLEALLIELDEARSADRDDEEDKDKLMSFAEIENRVTELGIARPDES